MTESPIELVSHFATFLIEVDGEIPVNDFRWKADEYGIDVGMSGPELKDHFHDNREYTVRKKGDREILVDATPNGDCPQSIETLYDDHEKVIPPWIVDDEEGAGDSHIPIGEVDGITDAVAAELANVGCESTADIASADLQAVAQDAKGVSLADVRTVAREAQQRKAAANNLARLKREALASNLGVDVPDFNPPAADDIVEQARQENSYQATVHNLEQIDQDAGVPLAYKHDLESDGPDELFYRDVLPVLEDTGHEYIPDMEGKIPPKTVEKDTGKDTLDELCIAMAQDGVTPFLQGPKGAGKNYAIEWVAYQINSPMFAIDASESMLPKDVLGITVPDGDNEIKFEDRALTRCAEHGVKIVVNAVRSLPSALQTALYQLLEREKLAIEEGQKMIEVHPNFDVIATANPNTVEYDNAGSLDSAFASRFRIIDWPYLPLSEEVDFFGQLINRGEHLMSREQVIKPAVKIAHQTRDEREYPTMSTRDLKDIFKRIDATGRPAPVLDEWLEANSTRRHDTAPLKSNISETVPQSL